MVNINDVELEKLLGEDPAPVALADGASAEKEGSGKETEVTPQAEDISQRAQERIRDLVDENNRLKEKKEIPMDIESFLGAVQDEPSRNLLRQFYQVVEQDVQKKFSPVMSEYHGSKFEKEFTSYEQKFPELAQHKADIKKTFDRNPSQSLRALVGERILEVQSAKIVPLEGQKSETKTAPSVDLNTASKEDLYSMLESMKK